MSKCNACKGKGCDYCDEFDLGMCIPPRKPTRMAQRGWLVTWPGLRGAGFFVTKREAVAFADNKPTAVYTRVYAKVSDVKGGK